MEPVSSLAILVGDCKLGEAQGFSSLKTYLPQFKVLSSLQKGERIHNTETGISSKYSQPSNSLHSMVQALFRNFNGQNTERDLRAVGELTQKTTSCFSELSLTELVVGYDEKISLLYKLQKHIERCIAVFESFKSTCASGNSNFIALDERKRQSRDKFASEIHEQLRTLSQVVRNTTSKFERINLELDIRHCQNFCEILTSTDSDQKLKHLYPHGGLPIKVLSCAARSVLSEMFGGAHVAYVFGLYKLEYKATLTLYDFQSLLIGLIAHYNLEDMAFHKEGPLSQLFVHHPPTCDKNLHAILLNAHNITLSTITPLERYKAILECDTAFLQAQRKARLYDKPNLHINQLNRFNYLEHQFYDLLDAFKKHPLACTKKGMLFYSYNYEGKAKCVEVFPVLSQDQLSCLVLLPATPKSASVLRVIVSDKDIPISKEVFEEFFKRLNGQRFILEIVAGNGTCSQVLNALLQFVPEQQIDEVNIYCFGQVSISNEVQELFAKTVEQYKAITFTVRHFLEKARPMQAIVGVPISLMQNHKNFKMTLVYLARDREYIESTNIPKRYFSHLDEREGENLSYIAEIKTSSQDDQQITQGFSAHERTKPIPIETLNESLIPTEPAKSRWFSWRA